MKILHVIPSYYPAIKLGGPVQSVHLLNTYLVKKGLSVDVLTLNAGLNSDDIKVKTWYNVDGVRVKYFNFTNFFRFAVSLSFFRNYIKVIRNYDLIHFTGIWNFPIISGLILSHFFKKRFVISPRGALYLYTVQMRKSVIKKVIFNVILKYYLKKSEFIHFTSLIDQENFYQFTKLKTKSIIIPNGLDLTKFNSIDESEFAQTKKEYLFFLGRIHPIKGIDILLKAFFNISTKYSGLILIISGPDEEGYLLKVQSQIEELGLKNRIILTGLLDFDSKIHYLKNAKMLILPSQSENFGNVVIEAMACGCPVVISDKVGISKEVDQNEAGIIVKTTVQSVEEGILKLLNDENLRKKIAANGKAMVEKYYDIEKVAEQMSEQYKLVISNQ